MMTLENLGSFLWRHWKLVLGGLALAVLGVMLVIAKGDARHWRKVAEAEKAAHQLTVTSYRAAAEKARADDLANVARVQRDQQAITERITDAYQDRLASADVRYDRLRAQAAAYSGGERDPDLSAAGEAACRAYAGTGCSGIPPLLKAAQDNTDRLVALQAWNRAQAGVEVDGRGD